MAKLELVTANKQVKFKSTSDLNDVIDDEVAQYTTVLGVLSKAWHQIDKMSSNDVIMSVDDICKLSLTTMKILEARRKCIFVPKGTTPNNTPKPNHSSFGPYLEDD